MINTNTEHIEEIELRKDLINGDVMDYQYNIIERIESIPGILKLNDRSFMDRSNKKNIYLKKFIPYDNKYPIMAVKTRVKYHHSNKFVVINNFKYYNKLNMFIANIKITLGDIGDIKAEEEYLLYKYNLKTEKQKNTNIIDEDINDPFKDIRIDMTDKYIISIDPEGSLDIDDAFHIEKHDDIYELGIHIADVSSYIVKDSEDDIIAQNKTSTIYLATKRDDMLNKKYATDICSLKENKIRYSTSVIFKIDTDYNIIDYKFIKGKIINKKNYSYDEFENNIHKLPLINEFYEFSKIMYPKIVKGDIIKIIKYKKEDFDSHKFIELLMILTNYYCGKYLDKAIYRVNDGLDNNVHIENDPYGIISFLSLEKSKYSIEGSHKMLGLDNYAYMTSPIRRYADLYNHYLINNKLINNESVEIEEIINIINHLNFKETNIKKCQRDAVKLKLIDEILEDKIYDGYLVQQEDNKFSFYINSLKTILDMKLVEDELKFMYNIEKKDNDINIYDLELKKILNIKIGEKVGINIKIFRKEINLNNKFKLIMIKDDEEFNLYF